MSSKEGKDRPSNDILLFYKLNPLVQIYMDGKPFKWAQTSH